MFISFEGVDGAGKTTQIKKFAKYLEDKGVDFIQVREPGGTNFSELIREILLDPEVEMSNRSELLLFESARADLVDKVIKPALDKGKVVISDRFYDSTTVYQSYGRGIDLKSTLKLHGFAVNGVHPDKTIFLNLDFEVSQERVNRKNKDRMESAGIEFHKKVYEGFQSIKDIFPERIIEIDANRSIDEIFDDILNKLEIWDIFLSYLLC